MGTLGKTQTFVSGDAKGFPENHIISEYSMPKWNEAGTQIFFGIKEQQDEVKKDDELEANVDVCIGRMKKFSLVR